MQNIYSIENTMHLFVFNTQNDIFLLTDISSVNKINKSDEKKKYLGACDTESFRVVKRK